MTVPCDNSGLSKLRAIDILTYLVFASVRKKWFGFTLGTLEGFDDGCRDGVLEGSEDGRRDGTSDTIIILTFEGIDDG